MGLKNDFRRNSGDKSIGSGFQRSGDKFKSNFQFGRYARDNIMSPQGKSSNKV